MSNLIDTKKQLDFKAVLLNFQIWFQINWELTLKISIEYYYFWNIRTERGFFFIFKITQMSKQWW